jgi:hypothetical protein
MRFARYLESKGNILHREFTWLHLACGFGVGQDWEYTSISVHLLASTLHSNLTIILIN